MRKIYYIPEPSQYTYTLFDMYYDALSRAYYNLNNMENEMNIDGVKNILYLIISLIKNFDEMKFIVLEQKISQIRNEEDIIKVCFQVFETCAEFGLEVDLYKEVYLSLNSNQTNPKIVEIIKAISNNLIFGYEKSTKKSLLMFYLCFRHKLKNKIDEYFLDEKVRIYELNKKVMTAANDVGLFVIKVPKVSALI